MSNMLAMMLGGAGGAGGLPPLGELVKLPCAVCLYGAALSGSGREADPAVTMARGTLVCDAHVTHGFDTDDGSGSFARFVDRAYDAGDRETGRGQCGVKTTTCTFCTYRFGHRGPHQ